MKLWPEKSLGLFHPEISGKEPSRDRFSFFVEPVNCGKGGMRERPHLSTSLVWKQYVGLIGKKVYLIGWLRYFEGSYERGSP